MEKRRAQDALQNARDSYPAGESTNSHYFPRVGMRTTCLHVILYPYLVAMNIQTLIRATLARAPARVFSYSTQGIETRHH